MTAKNFKIIGFCMAAAFLVMAFATGAYADNAGKIVTVDTNKIMQSHPAFTEAQQTLQGEARQMQQEMQDKNQQEQQAAQQQFQERSQKLQQEALDEVRDDIQKIADEKGYDYVMDTNALLAGGEDVTDEIMEELSENQDQD